MVNLFLDLLDLHFCLLKTFHPVFLILLSYYLHFNSAASLYHFSMEQLWFPDF